MAKILLNVELESKTFQAQLQKIKEQLDRTFSSGGAGGGVGGGIKAAKAQVESLQKSFANLLNTLKGSEGKYAPDTFKELKTQITNALNATKALNKEMGDGKPTDEQRKEYARLNKQLSTLSSTFATVRVENEKLQKENKLAIPNVDNLRKKYANLLTTIQGQEKYYKKGTFSKLTEDIKEQQKKLIGLDETSENFADTVNTADKKLNEFSRTFAETRQESKNFHGSLGEIVKGFIKFQAAAMIVMKPLQLIRSAWADLNETLVETENRTVELRRVAGEVANSDELYKLAQQYGQTFENVSEITLNFARNGMEWTEALEATEAALLAINVAELDATQASEGMIAVMNQFGIAASELELVVDKLNITADNAAVTTEKLLLALQRTGSSAKNAKLDLEETVGIITALSEATGRSGENLGTAVNSLIQFSTKASSLETFEKLGGSVAETVELYRQGGATVLDIWEELSNVIGNSQTAEDILGENFTTEEFEALNEELKQSLGEEFAQTTEIYDTASTFRKNYFIALLQNLDQVEETLEKMNGAQGYSQDENLQYLDTYTARVNDLQAKWQDMASDEQGLLGIKKLLVEFASGLLDVLDFLGGIRTVLIGVGIAAVGAFGPSIVASIGKIVTALKAATTQGQLFQASMGWISVAGMALSALVGWIQDYNKEQEQANELAISAWKANEKNADKLQELYDKYKSLGSDSKEYKNTEEELVKLLGDKAELLKGLTKGTEEYRLALAKLVELEGTEYQLEKEKAIRAATKNLEDAKLKNVDLGAFSSRFINGDETTEGFIGYGKNLQELLEEAGIKNVTTKETGTQTSRGGTTVGRFTTNLQLETSGGKTAEEKIKDYENYVNAYTAIMAEAGKQVASGNIEYAEYLKDTAIKIYDQANKLKEDVETYQYLTKEPEQSKEQPSGGGGGSTETINLSDIVNELKSIRENTEKTNELEEKQLDIEEKRQALEDAKNQRTVRVFNAETGQWEQVANQKNIDKATKDLAEAEKDLQETAKENMLDYLSTEEAQEKLNKGELTLPSWIAEALAQPKSDDEYQAYLKSEGILSGAVNKTPTSSGAVYNNSSNNTTNNNQSYSLNGIPIPAIEAGRYFTKEALDLLNQMGD